MDNLPPDLVMADGEVRVKGRRIGLYDIMKAKRQDEPAESIADRFDLAPELVARVLAFAEERKAEVDAYVDEYRADLDRIEAAHPPSEAILRIRRLMEERRRAAGQEP